jgi:hypothetical protein
MPNQAYKRQYVKHGILANATTLWAIRHHHTALAVLILLGIDS